MSDEEDFLSEESYEFEFEEDEDDGVEENENHQDYGMYYNAKGLKDDDPERAIKELRVIIEADSTDEENIEWIFKSYKQLMKINFSKQRYDETLKYFEKLTEIMSKVNKNYSEESMSKILNNYSLANDKQFVSRLYDIILDFLDQSSGSEQYNDRLWLKININKLNILLENREFDKCSGLIKSINHTLSLVSETTRNSYSLEVIAAEIEYYSQSNRASLSELNQLYRKSMTITTAVTHPKIMGTIRECGAKVHFYRGNYEKARLEFYECFKNFDETGSPLKKKILKYLTLCSMLAENEVNPFESQETQTYSQLSEYTNLILLIKCYDELDLQGFNGIIEKIKAENDPLANDEIFNFASNRILENLRSKIIINLLKSYRIIKFEYITKKLNINQEQLEEMILKLASNGKLLNAKLDFISGYIEIDSKQKMSPLPLTIDSKEIYHNMRCLDAINMNGDISDNNDSSDVKYDVDDSMEIDTDSRPRTATSIFEQDASSPSPNKKQRRESILSKILLFNDMPSLEEEWFAVIDSWYKYISSAIPAQMKDELSQKDQIFSEQRAENASNNNLVSMNVNELNPDHSNRNSITQRPTNIAQTSIDESSEFSGIDRIDTLINWCRELRHYQNKLSTVYS
ncbi:DEHA2B11176p [Debaryomyces hansenii CBS767]|uniref:DEHA2B11176p n=1 Tax=Debaryomyces hansenii (strain ATCC 36239 / CBS 767 / BCRC 21394 / JCM 1990 / NBRC 0083 / IGC 2968) TaxID=284592 RepID=Q6BWI1_DEBHA|nr:DEHA2B11176p [Debaryomyces hansenii CBS767]CAG85442.2 DEHA2B11176p [Debaryomyces hansenii CBS767]|eukprot:XP_457438.2 DEHA2B11176p [Debaryomyces hansenii CBS767]